MHFPGEGSRKTLLFFTVLTSWAIGYGETAGDKTLNLRIGFDLTQGKNGAPALRIRDFEDSAENDRYPRAAENENISKETDNVNPAIRADSFSESMEEKVVRNEDSSREANSQSNGDSDDDSDGNNKRDGQKSTKGIYPEEYEPEENAKVHGRFNEDDEDSDADADVGRRHKRQAIYESDKRKNKKVLSFRKVL